MNPLLLLSPNTSLTIVAFFTNDFVRLAISASARDMTLCRVMVLIRLLWRAEPVRAEPAVRKTLLPAGASESGWWGRAVTALNASLTVFWKSHLNKCDDVRYTYLVSRQWLVVKLEVVINQLLAVLRRSSLRGKEEYERCREGAFIFIYFKL